MVCSDPIQGQGHQPFKAQNLAVFKSYLLRHLRWELATDHGFLNKGTISKFDWARFLIFGLVFVSRDFEVGTNVSCKESTVSPCTELIFNVCKQSRSNLNFWLNPNKWTPEIRVLSNVCYRLAYRWQCIAGSATVMSVWLFWVLYVPLFDAT